MKPLEESEFRIGNYISHPNAEIDRVEEIMCKEVSEGKQYAIKPEKYHIAYYLSHKGEALIKGVPITPERLIKMGFVKDPETDYRWLLEDWLAYDVDDNTIRIVDSWEFGKRHFVHQLQNLYHALTQKELEFEL